MRKNVEFINWIFLVRRCLPGVWARQSYFVDSIFCGHCEWQRNNGVSFGLSPQHSRCQCIAFMILFSKLYFQTNRSNVLKLAYTGSNTVRGMVVNQWQTCLYSASKSATLKVTLSWTGNLNLNISYNYVWFHLIEIELNKDSDKWTPSAPTATTPSVPVEVKIESSNNSLLTNVDIYSITEFRTTIELQEEDLFVIFFNWISYCLKTSFKWF